MAMALVLTMTVSFLWQLHVTDSNDRLHLPSSIEWQQPSSLSDQFPQAISVNVWPFDFEASEQILLTIQPNKNGAMTLNANTAKVLDEAVSKLPQRLSDSAIQRLALLVTKGLTGKSGHELAQIFTQFYQFKQAWNAVKNTPPDTMNKEALFHKMVLLQNKYLGKHMSSQLFGKKNAVTHYLYARKRINNDSYLNQAQKQLQLENLQVRFKANDL